MPGRPRIMDLDAARAKDREKAEKKEREKEERAKERAQSRHNVVHPDRSGSKNPNALSEEVKKERIAFWLDGMRQSKPMDVLTREFTERFCPESKNPVSLANSYRREALKYLEENLVSSAGKFRAVQMDRLETLYQRCLERENFKVALSVIDTMNKLMGVYKAEQVLVTPVTQFNFGDEALQMARIPTLVVPEGYVPQPEPEENEESFEEAEQAVGYLSDNEEEEDVGF